MLRPVAGVVLALISTGINLAEQLAGAVRTEAPLSSGTGATVVVTAPEALCRDDVELMVSRTVFAGRNAVFQAPVAPPVCQWVIEDARPGEYQAVLQMARGDRRIIAMSQFDAIGGHKVEGHHPAARRGGRGFDQRRWHSGRGGACRSQAEWGARVVVGDSYRRERLLQSHGDAIAVHVCLGAAPGIDQHTDGGAVS